MVITLTTIGYGDFSPTTPLTKLITMFYGVNGVIVGLIRRIMDPDMPPGLADLDELKKDLDE